MKIPRFINDQKFYLFFKGGGLQVGFVLEPDSILWIKEEDGSFEAIDGIPAKYIKTKDMSSLAAYHPHG